jgi:ATP-dependent protease ClpP protease subunit
MNNASNCLKRLFGGHEGRSLRLRILQSSREGAMWDRLKGGGAILLGIASLIAILLGIALLINGGVYLGERIYPWLVKISGITLVVVLFLLLPLALFRRTRNFSGWGLSIASWVFGATLWVWGLLLTYQLWGGIALIIGLFLLGVGVVPIAMLATLFNGMWSTLGELLAVTALTFGLRIAGAFVLAKAATMPTTDFSAPQSPPVLSSNYFVRHWRGECSLGISYWFNGSVLAGIVPGALTMAVDLLEKGNYSLRAISFAGLGTLLFSVIAWLWSSVGIWRSASHHAARGGSSGWASAARVGVVFGTIAMAGQLSTTILPQVKEFALIASGNDPIGNIKINVATNGQSVIVHGMLREGSAVEVQKILDAAPGATLLVLNSAGGRLREAQQLALVVQSRHLNTYVEDQCASACTYVFLAGKDRAATPNAQIGFHQPSFPGLDANAQRAATETMLDVYRAAELPEVFMQRIAKTPPEDIWYPTRDELIAAHVITRVSLGGEAAITGLGMRSKQELLLIWGSTPLFQAIEKRFPGTTNEAVERGWAVKERGGADADIQNTVRSIIGEIIPTLLKTADVSTLDSFVKLMISEMSAAQAISGEACTMLLDGKLNIVQTMPKEIAEQDRQFLLQALASPPTTALPPPDPDQFAHAIQKVRVNLPQKYINVVDDMKAHANQPDLVCEAMIAFYRAIEALPPPERHVALRGMVRGED